MRGFSTIEMLIALMLLSSLLIATMLLISSAPRILERAREQHRALVYTESALMREERRSVEEFSAIRSYSTTTPEGDTLLLTATLLPDRVTKRLEATLMPLLTLRTYVVDYRSEDTYACDVLPHGDWANPVITTYTVSPGGLLPSPIPSGTITEIAATTEYLAFASETTTAGNLPSLFLFSIEGERPQFLSSLPTSSTTAAVSDLVITRAFAYVASASTCSTATRCGQLKIIDLRNPLQLRILSQLLLPRTSPPYAGDTGSATAAKSLFYTDDYVYLGLEQTPSSLGQEFNVIDVQDPSRPVLRGGYRVGRTINDIYVWEGRAYLGTNARGAADVLVLDSRDPARITEVARVGLPPLQPTSTFGYAHVIGLYDNELHVGRSYVSNADEWVISDVSHAAVPIRASVNKGTALRPSSVRSLILREAQAIVVTTREVEIWSRDTAFAPHLLTSIPVEGATAAVCTGNDIYVLSVAGSTSRLTRITAL